MALGLENDAVGIFVYTLVSISFSSLFRWELSILDKKENWIKVKSHPLTKKRGRKKMYQYTLRQMIKEEEKIELVFSSQHYTEAGFKKVVKEAIKELKDDGFYLPPEKRLDMIKRELINNHEFINCTNNNISFDITKI